MRLIIFYDLPNSNKQEMKIYSKFRKNLLDDGFIMIQYSVYSRFCRNHAAVSKHINRIKTYKPKSGDIRLMAITEKQYLSMTHLSGEFTYVEKLLSSDPIVEV